MYFSVDISREVGAEPGTRMMATVEQLTLSFQTTLQKPAGDDTIHLYLRPITCPAWKCPTVDYCADWHVSDMKLTSSNVVCLPGPRIQWSIFMWHAETTAICLALMSLQPFRTLWTTLPTNLCWAVTQVCRPTAFQSQVLYETILFW